MFSNKTYTEIIRVANEALREIGTPEVIDCVTVIQGYMHVLSRVSDSTEHEWRISVSVRKLLEMARRHKKPDLVNALETLLATIDEERKS